MITRPYRTKDLDTLALVCLAPASLHSGHVLGLPCGPLGTMAVVLAFAWPEP